MRCHATDYGRSFRTQRSDRVPDPYETGFRGEQRGLLHDRPWVDGYRDEYQGGSGGVPVNTTAPRFRGAREAPEWEGRGGERRPGGYDQGFRQRARSGESRGREAYDRSYGGGRQRGGDRQRPEEWRPRYSPVGGMHPAMGGEFKYRGETHRGTGYDGWYGQRTRWF